MIGGSAPEITACEAAVALNLAVSDLLLPKHIFGLVTGQEEVGRVARWYAIAARRVAMQIVAVNLFRLHEAREQLLCPWLFSDEELRGMAFVPLAEFVGSWPALLTIRHQFAGHMLSRESDRGQPGRILAPEVSGRVWRESGLLEADVFLTRVENELIPAVERVRSELFRRWPATEDYVRRIYPAAFDRGAGLEAGRSDIPAR